jgi:hypothetical protein
MADSFINTRTDTINEMMFLIDDDDKNTQQVCEEYRKMYGGFHYATAKRSSITVRLNEAFHILHGYDYYHITNDDVIYRTQAWDFLLIDSMRNKQGVAYGNDLLCGAGQPTHPIISGDICRCLGWVQLPSLTHLYGDAVWKVIGHKLNSLHYRGDIIIEHIHPLARKREADTITSIVNSDSMYNTDREAFLQWVHNDMENDINKIRKELYA